MRPNKNNIVRGKRQEIRDFSGLSEAFGFKDERQGAGWSSGRGYNNVPKEKIARGYVTRISANIYAFELAKNEDALAWFSSEYPTYSVADPSEEMMDLIKAKYAEQLVEELNKYLDTRVKPELLKERKKQIEFANKLHAVFSQDSAWVPVLNRNVIMPKWHEYIKHWSERVVNMLGEQSKSIFADYPIQERLLETIGYHVDRVNFDWVEFSLFHGWNNGIWDWDKVLNAAWERAPAGRANALRGVANRRKGLQRAHDRVKSWGRRVRPGPSKPPTEAIEVSNRDKQRWARSLRNWKSSNLAGWINKLDKRDGWKFLHYITGGTVQANLGNTPALYYKKRLSQKQ